MKIAVLGYSGSGKSTLARKLGALYNADVLHFDTVQFLPGWEIRSLEEKRRLTGEFLDAHDSWIIDGNYTRLFYQRRLEEADQIVLLLFNRLACLRRVTLRYRRYKNTTRPDMAQGCKEKLDWEFITWVLWKGRGREVRDRFEAVRRRYGPKVTVLKNQRQLDAYMARLPAL